MTRDELIQCLARLAQSKGVVKAARTDGPTNYDFEIYVPESQNDIRVGDERSTYSVTVFLQEGDAPQGKQQILAYSTIGPRPEDPELMRDLLRENLDGHYSRIAILLDELVQIFKYPLGEVAEFEMINGFREVAQYARYYRQRYIGNG